MTTPAHCTRTDWPHEPHPTWVTNEPGIGWCGGELTLVNPPADVQATSGPPTSGTVGDRSGSYAIDWERDGNVTRLGPITPVVGVEPTWGTNLPADATPVGLDPAMAAAWDQPAPTLAPTMHEPDERITRAHNAGEPKETDEEYAQRINAGTRVIRNLPAGAATGDGDGGE